jgi:hypothetical protein
MCSFLIFSWYIAYLVISYAIIILSFRFLVGPRHINLSTDGTIIRATTGLPFRPIICAAECYPMCNFTWKLTIDYKYNITMVGPNLTIEAPQINDSGVYTCFIVHQYDNSRVISASIELVFNGKYGIKKSNKCKQNSIVDTFVLVPNKGWVKFHLEQACGCCVMPSKQFVSYITARTSHISMICW